MFFFVDVSSKVQFMVYRWEKNIANEMGLKTFIWILLTRRS